MKRILLFAIPMVLSCTDNSLRDIAFSDENAGHSVVKSYYSPQEEAKALAMPMDQLYTLPKYVKEQRAAAIVLSRFTVLKDRQYRIDISKDSAAKLGVTAEMYDAVAAELEKSNGIIREMDSSGNKMELPDVQKAAGEYFEDGDSLACFVRSGDGGRNQYGAIRTSNNEEYGADWFYPQSDKKVLFFNTQNILKSVLLGYM